MKKKIMLLSASLFRLCAAFWALAAAFGVISQTYMGSGLIFALAVICVPLSVAACVQCVRGYRSRDS